MNNPERETAKDSAIPNHCQRTTTRQDRRNETADRWITDTSALEVELPTDVQARLGQLLGEAPVETLGDWIAGVRRMTGGGAIAIDDLCHSNAETGHWGEMNGNRYHFRCFYDAVVLAALADQPVDIRTESPGGAIIMAKAAGTTDLTVMPSEAVFSFGIHDRLAPSRDGDPSPAEVYAAVCPYVRAFPHPDAYNEWASSVSAATVAMPLAGATDLAAALIE